MMQNNILKLFKRFWQPRQTKVVRQQLPLSIYKGVEWQKDTRKIPCAQQRFYPGCSWYRANQITIPVHTRIVTLVCGSQWGSDETPCKTLCLLFLMLLLTRLCWSFPVVSWNIDLLVFFTLISFLMGQQEFKLKTFKNQLRLWKECNEKVLTIFDHMDAWSSGNVSVCGYVRSISINMMIVN